MSKQTDHTDFAVAEMDRLGVPAGDTRRENVKALLTIFQSMGGSEEEQRTVFHIFSRVTRMLPASDLTGADDEWEEVVLPVTGVKMWRNVRCLNVFKDHLGQAYMVGSHVLMDQAGRLFPAQAMPINFPYYPPDTPTVLPIYTAPPVTPGDSLGGTRETLETPSGYSGGDPHVSDASEGIPEPVPKRHLHLI